MAEIGSWKGHTFTVSPTLIRSFSGLTIKGSSETEDKTGSGQKYVSRKNGNPSEISLTVELNALTGCNVKDEALKFVNQAHNGAKDYFYLGGKKLVACQLMLVEASVTETAIAANGTWTSCKVKLVMKQCAKYDGTGSDGGSGGGGSGGGNGSSGGSKKTSTKKSTSLVSKVVDTAKKVATAVKTAVKTVASKVSSVVSAVKKINTVVSNAKKASAPAKKTTSVVKKVSTASKKIKALAK